MTPEQLEQWDQGYNGHYDGKALDVSSDSHWQQGWKAADADRAHHQQYQQDSEDLAIYLEIEKFVGTETAAKTRTAYSADLSEEDRSDWKMAIMTHIAQGNRQDLEREFPEYARANPANHDW